MSSVFSFDNTHTPCRPFSCGQVTGTAATASSAIYTNVGTAYSPSAWFGVIYADAFGNPFTSGTSVLGNYMTITAATTIGSTTAVAGTVSGTQAYVV